MGITWGELNAALIEKARENRIPIVGQFELTARCNMQCRMCYVCQPSNDKDIMKGERTADEWIELAGKARDAGMLFLLLTGGEVLIRQDFRRIYEEISKLGLNIKVYTNATMVTPELAKWLGRIPPSMIEVTMYGASADTYRKVCGCEEGYESAKRGIKLLQSEGITLTIRTTLIRDNIKDFNKLAEFADSMGIPFGAIDYITPRREEGATNPYQVRLSPIELMENRRQLDKHFSRSQANRTNIKSYDSQGGIKPGSKPNRPFSCGAGSNTFWVTWQGLMTPCGDVSEPASSPFEEGFESAWNNLNRLSSDIPVCSECQQCSLKEFCITCPARLKSETGHYDRKAPYLCELAELESNKKKRA